MRASEAVVNLLKLAERPDVISLAGGLPDPSTFHLERIRCSSENVLRGEGAEAMNYGPNQGYSRLREWVASRMTEREKVATSSEEVLIVSGGLEAIHLASLALIDPGDLVLVGSPTYLVALHVFRAHQASIESVPLDAEGMVPEALEETLSRLDRLGRKPKFLYVIPSFQNPSGLTLPLARRQRLVEICLRSRLPILEDHAYADLAYDQPPLPSLKSMAPESVIFAHTFSKIFGPGVRLGWVSAEPFLIQKLGLCKLGTDQCANTFTQRILFDFASRGWLDDQIQASLPIYRRKRDLLLRSLEGCMPEGVSWTRPGGGFYVWITLPKGADSETLLRKAIEREGVAFVAGPPFFADGGGARHLRLSFSYVGIDHIPEAVRRLSRLLSSETGSA